MDEPAVSAGAGFSMYGDQNVMAHGEIGSPLAQGECLGLEGRK